MYPKHSITVSKKCTLNTVSAFNGIIMFVALKFWNEISSVHWTLKQNEANKIGDMFKIKCKQEHVLVFFSDTDKALFLDRHAVRYQSGVVLLWLLNDDLKYYSRESNTQNKSMKSKQLEKVILFQVFCFRYKEIITFLHEQQVLRLMQHICTRRMSCFTSNCMYIYIHLFCLFREIN